MYSILENVMGENMTKTEFIERLCSALSAPGAMALVEKNRTYYSEYIEGEIAKGRNEAEVLEDLGAPELIANSILEANGLRDRFVDDDSKTFNAYDTPDGDPTTFAQGFEYKGNEKDKAPTGEAAGEKPKAAQKGMSPKTTAIIILIVAALILIGIIVLLILLVGGIFALLGPILIPILIAWLIVRLLRSR